MTTSWRRPDGKSSAVMGFICAMTTYETVSEIVLFLCIFGYVWVGFKSVGAVAGSIMLCGDDDNIRQFRKKWVFFCYND